MKRKREEERKNKKKKGSERQENRNQRKHGFLPWMSKKSSASTGGPLSMALPEPLNTRPEKQKSTK